MSKYNVLVLGGTRFIGKLVVTKLIDSGHSVTVNSRKKIEWRDGLTQITGLRSNLKNREISLDEFDFVLDFNAYSISDFLEIPEGCPKSSYIFISSQWVSTIAKGKSELFSTTEIEYVDRKLLLEGAVREKFLAKARIIRLPVIVGDGDHHQRLNFLTNRINLKSRLILPSRDLILDFAWVEDVANIILKAIEFDAEYGQITRIQSSEPVTYRGLVEHISEILFRKIEWVEVDPIRNQKNLLNFLKADAFWREEYLRSTVTNLGEALSYTDLPFERKFFAEKFLSFESKLFEIAIDEEAAFLNG